MPILTGGPRISQPANRPCVTPSPGATICSMTPSRRYSSSSPSFRGGFTSRRPSGCGPSEDRESWVEDASSPATDRAPTPGLPVSPHYLRSIFSPPSSPKASSSTKAMRTEHRAIGCWKRSASSVGSGWRRAAGKRWRGDRHATWAWRLPSTPDPSDRDRRGRLAGGAGARPRHSARGPLLAGRAWRGAAAGASGRRALAVLEGARALQRRSPLAGGGAGARPGGAGPGPAAGDDRGRHDGLVPGGRGVLTACTSRRWLWPKRSGTARPKHSTGRSRCARLGTGRLRAGNRPVRGEPGGGPRGR